MFSLNEKLSTQLKMKYHKPLQKKKKQHTLITLIITLHHQIITMLIYCLLSAMTEDFLSNVQSFFSSSASQESEGSGLGWHHDICTKTVPALVHSINSPLRSEALSAARRGSAVQN